MAKVAPQIREIYVGEVRNISVDFSGMLDDEETLSGTPTVAIISGSGLAFSNEQTNAAAEIINGATVPIDHAVMFTCDAASAVANSNATLLVTCSTSEGQTLKGVIKVRVY